MKTIQINNKYYQECDIVILSTDKAEDCLVLSANRLCFFHGYFTQEYLKSQDKKSYHLYILSDEKPKVGDWSINLNSRHAHKELCRIDNEIELERYVNKVGNNCKKIIATTDSSLWLHDDTVPYPKTKTLPQIPHQFIEHFIVEYNKSNVIDKVLVEVKYNELYPMVQNNNFKVTLNQSNEISILTEQKQVFTREEVIEFCKKAKNFGATDSWLDYIKKNL